MTAQAASRPHAHAEPSLRGFMCNPAFARVQKLPSSDLAFPQTKFPVFTPFPALLTLRDKYTCRIVHARKAIVSYARQPLLLRKQPH